MQIQERWKPNQILQKSWHEEELAPLTHTHEKRKNCDTFKVSFEPLQSNTSVEQLYKLLSETQFK